MSRGVFGALKDAVLILDEIRRLNENIRKLVDRVNTLERRLAEQERDRAATAETHAGLIERIVRLEHAVTTTPKPRKDRPRLGRDGER